MNLFYRENIEEHPSVIFTKFSTFHALNEPKTIHHYKRSLNWNNDVIPVKHTKKKNSTTEGFASAFSPKDKNFN